MKLPALPGHIKVRVVVLLIILTAAAAFNGCGAVSSVNYSLPLQMALSSKWSEYASGKTGWKGAIAVYMVTPKGNFFASTDRNNIGSENQHFRAASTTKSFTAAAILLLQQRDLLNIDDKITALIPGSTETYVPNTADYNIPNKNQITIKELLMHRAGVFDVSNSNIPASSSPYAGKNYITYVETDLAQPQHDFTFDELVGIVAKENLSYFAPDADFHYSNTGYSMLGKIIERVSGKTYCDFISSELLVPNGLGASSLPFLGADIKIPAPFVDGYLWYAGSSFLVTEDNMSPHVAEGNLLSTMSDLSAWVKKLLTGNAGLNSTQISLMKACRLTGESHYMYGLGCVYTPGLGYGHNGGHAGYLTVMRYDSKQDVTVIILCSGMNADPTDQLPVMYNIGFAAKELMGYPTAEAE